MYWRAPADLLNYSVMAMFRVVLPVPLSTTQNVSTILIPTIAAKASTKKTLTISRRATPPCRR